MIRWSGKSQETETTIRASDFASRPRKIGINNAEALCTLYFRIPLKISDSDTTASEEKKNGEEAIRRLQRKGRGPWCQIGCCRFLPNFGNALGNNNSDGRGRGKNPQRPEPPILPHGTEKLEEITPKLHALSTGGVVRSEEEITVVHNMCSKSE